MAISDEAADLLCKMLRKDQADRISCAAALEHAGAFVFESIVFQEAHSRGKRIAFRPNSRGLLPAATHHGVYGFSDLHTSLPRPYSST